VEWQKPKKKEKYLEGGESVYNVYERERAEKKKKGKKKGVFFKKGSGSGCLLFKTGEGGGGAVVD